MLAGLNTLTTRDLAELEITPQTARALVVLLQHQQLRCALMARLLGLEATALSHLLRAMSRDQLIVRNRVDNDNRAVEVAPDARRARAWPRTCQDLALAHERQLLEWTRTRRARRARPRFLTKLCDNVTPPERRVGVSRSRTCVAKTASRKTGAARP